MRAVLIAVLALPLGQDAAGPKRERAFAEEGLKLGNELLGKGFSSEARFLGGLVGSRVGEAKGEAERLIGEAKTVQANPRGREAETRIGAFGRRWAAEWRRAKGGEAGRLAVEAEILDVLAEHAKAYALFNRRRSEAGVGTVDYDFGLSYGCQRHARYLALHPDAEDPHTEEEGRAGFSEEGRRAAENSVIGKGRSLNLAVEDHLATLYHRAGMLSPLVTDTGLGITRDNSNLEHTVIDISSISSTSTPSPQFVPYPPDGFIGLPHLMWAERPSPVPVDKQFTVGYPVSLSFFQNEEQILDSTAELWELGSPPIKVECYFSSPSVPANIEVEHNDGIIGLIPRKSLRANTSYRAVIECRFCGELLRKEWTFKTGNKSRPD